MKANTEKKQIVSTVSQQWKEWSMTLRARHTAPGATTDAKEASERELSDALYTLFTAPGSVNEETGESSPNPHLTALESALATVLSARGTGKVNKATLASQVDTLKAQADQQAARIAELLAALEAAKAQPPAPPAKCTSKRK